MRKAEVLQPATFPTPLDSAHSARLSANLSSRIAAGAGVEPMQLTRTGRQKYENFSPLGMWSGSYTCSQGTTGATLDIKSLKGDHFEGTFRFYPTTKNPYVAKGEYAVFGEYDSDSQRILVNPGKWIERPDGYYSTIMIGSFDPVENSFSGYFQGIMGCTSFEAHANSDKAKNAEAKVEDIKKTSKKKASSKKSKK
jgi:hypothetical protein